jgi:hypothetical protein
MAMKPALFAALLLTVSARDALPQAPRFELTVSAAVRRAPLSGRLVLVLARRAEPEPRFTIAPTGPALLAVDLEQQLPGRPVLIDTSALGHPVPLGELPPGEYFAQAVINVYEEVRRADGHRIMVPMNDGRQETVQIRPGNLYSDVVPVRIGSGGTIQIAIDKVIPPRPSPADTEWVKRVPIQSRKLTAFWGRPVFVNATVLLPRGYAEHPEARYPVVYTFGHNVPFSFNPDSTRVRGIGTINPVTGVESGYDFYRSWISDSFPRFIAVSFEQQTPYFPDSYSVNSANNGPYGDAMIEEVIPFLEQRFRIIPKAYARLVEGASTGGWQSLALQLKHPDVFGGAWILQPDPIDFRKHLLVNIYADTNAFIVPTGPFSWAERPFRRTTEGQMVWTMRELSRFEEVLGTRGRAGSQLTGWEAIFGPVGSDGYPKPLWNKLTGTIDKDVAEYWREQGYDLREYAQRNWPTLGQRLANRRFRVR